MARSFDIDDFASVLVVEGYSDLLFYAEAIEHVGRHGEVFIQEFGGVNDVVLALETFLTPELLATKKTIGIVVDADLNPKGRVQSVRSMLKNATNRNIEHGVWSNGPPKLGFFVVPDGASPGEIETLAWQAWSNDTVNASERECVVKYIACMDALGRRAHSPDKGHVGAILSILSDEDPRLGPGARTNAFSFDRPEFEPLLNFLREL